MLFSNGPAPQTPRTTTIRLDPIEVLTAFVAEMREHGERAECAAREGREREALLAVAAMQTLLRTKSGALGAALFAARSKRVSPETRAAVRKAAATMLAPIEQTVRVLETRLRARRVRQEAIGAALRAASTAPARAYTASLRRGPALPVHTVRHTLKITA